MDNQPDREVSEIPLPPLLAFAKELAIEELHRRLREEGFQEIRPSYGCVFRFIEPEGSRLTDLADRAQMTKQAIGEMVTDLEGNGYVERVPDAADRRAKIIRLTDSGREAQGAARRIFGDIEAQWAERYGGERIAFLREVLEEIVAGERTATVLAVRD